AEFWNVAVKVIDREYGRYLDDMIGPSGTPINHLSVFAVAPIPLLIYLGKRLGDISSVDVYQRHRFTKSWRWENIQDNLFDYAIDYPQIVGKPTKCVAVNLSLSGTIHSGEIIQSVGAGVPIYTIRISNPRRDFLIAKEYLELFANRWHRLLSDIRKIHGPSSEILLFPAVPNSVAVEIGRALRPKIDPSIHIYNKSWSDFEFVMTV
ncbi:MAG: SAVED domain-containing protein, partial [Ignavibacteriaceae bacterium]|nr:SAVED domain-containing protein [Ignavibacteriaceae bacterium]